jgi:hypothetical protein
MPTRTTVYLDEALVVRARRLVPARGLSQLVNDLLAERVAELERAELEAQMREGYIATRQYRHKLNADWKIIDGEGLPALNLHSVASYTGPTSIRRLGQR